jgi:hypothetical protein
MSTSTITITTSPCLDDEILYTQTVEPDIDTAREADVEIPPDIVPDFNTAVMLAGYPERGTEAYEHIARVYAYGYLSNGKIDILHSRWLAESVPDISMGEYDE